MTDISQSLSRIVTDWNAIYTAGVEMERSTPAAFRELTRAREACRNSRRADVVLARQRQRRRRTEISA